jgi:hypothetical protein
MAFDKIYTFHTDSIICQEVSISMFHSDTNTYDVNIELNNGTKVNFCMSSDDWFSLAGYISWHRGYLYILTVEDGLAKYFTSDDDLKNYIKGEN